MAEQAALTKFYCEITPKKIWKNKKKNGEDYYTVVNHDGGRYNAFSYEAIQHLKEGVSSMVYLLRKDRYVNIVTAEECENADPGKVGGGQATLPQTAAPVQPPSGAITAPPPITPAPSTGRPPYRGQGMARDENAIRRESALKSAIAYVATMSEAEQSLKTLPDLFQIADEMDAWIQGKRLTD